jgi:hypothetical protein
LNTTEVQTIKNLLIDIIFAMKIFYNDLFRAAPYRLILVLHKDALFHYKGEPFIFFSATLRRKDRSIPREWFHLPEGAETPTVEQV